MRPKRIKTAAQLTKHVCKIRGIDRYQLAKELKVAHSTVTRWLNGTVDPRGEHLWRLMAMAEEGAVEGSKGQK